ncbi:hypothetical protein VQH23_07465 [Pararoseomonas sp. SCSIO 73927]|uniref:Acb2/Tad1 domain-containing protein n=1 Tax=Pararoseomonas sp. SCSIO 73927 TaxID=3114537 RepID=UPI0030D0E0E2
MDQTSPPISGYRQLSPEEVEQINKVKALANQVGELVDQVRASGADPRWASIAATELQQGFMALNRSIAKPTGF